MFHQSHFHSVFVSWPFFLINDTLFPTYDNRIEISFFQHYQEKIMLRVMAKDKGIPPLSSNATITITLTTGNQNPPTWNENYEGQTYLVNETSPIGYPIATFSATSHVDPPLDGVSFALVDSNGNSQQMVEDFRVDSHDRIMKLKVANQLDVSVKSLYTLRLRVTVSILFQ